MTRLVCTTQAETFERLERRLGQRGIEVVSIQPTGRTLPIETSPFPEADVGWVYPSRLMEGAVVDSHLDVPWVNGRDAVLTSRNKAGVLTRLAAADVPVPNSRVVSNPADEAAVMDAAADLSFPIVVKPNSTTRGTGVTKISDPDSLSGVTDYLELVHDYRATGDQSYLLQEYVPEADDYRVMVLDKTYAGAVRRRLPAERVAEGAWKHNVHRGAVAEGVDLPSQLRRLAERTATVLDIDVLGVDLLVADDTVLVSETNARPTIDDASKYESGFDDRLADLVERTASRG